VKFTEVTWHYDRLDQPLRWRRPRRIFVNSMSDLFHEAVSSIHSLRVAGHR
jgi:protein gp37